MMRAVASAIAVAAVLDAGAGVFTALQEQLGLRLESISGSLEYFVIDSVERPATN